MAVLKATMLRISMPLRGFIIRHYVAVLMQLIGSFRNLVHYVALLENTMWHY